MIVPSRKKYKVVTEKNVPMKTRDGITLYADVIHPDMEGRFPVLLSRTPYFTKTICLRISSCPSSRGRKATTI